jgi:hypothetical protein
MNQWRCDMTRIEFHGGPRDGEVLSEPGDAVVAYAAMTGEFRQGGVLWCLTEYVKDVLESSSDSAIRDILACGGCFCGHWYEVAESAETGPIVLRHLGPAVTSRAPLVTFRAASV